MVKKLEKNGFLVIRNFIDKSRAKKLSKKFKEFCEKNPNECSPDVQIPGTPSKYNYDLFLELLCEKTPEVSKIIGNPVLPTYTYSRVYKNGDVLEKHTDRDSCEVSLTVHLDGDQEWKIYLETPEKKEKSVTLRKGDALLYYGCSIPHWRNSFEGEYYSQVFLHYVKSRGRRKNSYFDRTKKPKVNTSHSLGQYVKVYEDIIPHTLCDDILREYAPSDDWSKTETVSGLNTNVRNCSVISLSSRDTIERNFDQRQRIDNDIFQVTSFLLNKLIEDYGTNLSVTEDTGYDLLKYEVGQFYVQHTDSHTVTPRTLSCSMCLNDDYDGGEFAFFDRELKYKPKKGSMIVFPSNFMFPHEIMPVTNGTRYSIITWFR